MRILSEQIRDIINSVVSATDRNNWDAAYTHSQISGDSTVHHTHSNKALLDTYNQPNANITSAISLSHSHANKALLDTYNQTNSGITTAVTQTHTHSNKALLDTLSGFTNANLLTTITNQHTHLNKVLLDTLTGFTNAQLLSAISNSHTHSNIAILDATTASFTTALKTNYDTAYTNNHTHSNKATLDNLVQSVIDNSHTHSNKTLLDSLTSAGAGTSFLANDGTYKAVSANAAGSDMQVMFNDGGTLAGNSTFTFNKATNLITGSSVLGTDKLYVANTNTYLSKNVGNDLVFTDANSGSVTLATLVSGATNPWTVNASYLNYGTAGVNKVGINTTGTPDEALEVVGNIQADYFNSAYLRYKSSNLLLGPNAGDNEVGSNRLYVDNTNTASPLIYGEFDSRLLRFNGDVYVEGTKILNFGSATARIFRSTGDNLNFQDAVANSGNPIQLTELIDGTFNAAVADFTDLAAVQSITSGNKSTWNKASVIVTSGGGTNFLSDDGTYKPGGGGGVTPTDNILKWDAGSSYYRPYTDKTEAGGVSSGGKFYGGTDAPTNTNRLNYDGKLVTRSFFASNNTETPIQGTCGGNNYAGVTGINTAGGTGITGTSATGTAIYGQTTNALGTAAKFYNAATSTTPIIQAFVDITEKFVVDSTGVNIPSGSTYKINGVALTQGLTSLVDDVLDFQTDKYAPYADKPSGLGFYTGTTNPDGTTRLNLNGSFSVNGLSSFSSATVSSITTSLLVNTSSAVAYAVDINGGATIQNSSASKDILNLRYNVSGSGGNAGKALTITRDIGGTMSATGDLISITDNPSTSGTISGKVLTAIIGSTERISMNPRVADGASAIAYLFDTHNNLTDNGAKIISLKNNGTEIFYVNKVGTTHTRSTYAESSAAPGFYSYIDVTNNSIVCNGTDRMNLNPNTTNSSTSIAYLFDTHNSLTNATAKLTSFKNQGTEKANIDKDGKVTGLGGGQFGTNTNNSTFEADGTLVFNGTATVFNDHSPNSVTVGVGANAPSFTSYNGNLRAYEFVGTSLLKEIDMGFQLPHSYMEGTDITPHVHLFIPDDATGGTIKFYMEYTWANTDQTGTITTTTISGTLIRSANAGINNNAKIYFPAITGTGKTISSILMCRIYRDPTDVADTFGSSVWLKAADIHIQMDTVGSRTISSK